uniref:Candidate secreted effector n=1 Tax=Meloidogyne incognita TaxID=6306 RepID=A0A914L4T9_MELIC
MCNISQFISLICLSPTFCLFVFICYYDASFFLIFSITSVSGNAAALTKYYEKSNCEKNDCKKSN